MEIEKIKQGLLKELDNTIKKRKREDKEIELVIIHVLDFIDDFLTNEMTVRELKNKYNELGGER